MNAKKTETESYCRFPSQDRERQKEPEQMQGRSFWAPILLVKEGGREGEGGGAGSVGGAYTPESLLDGVRAGAGG
uniref:Uncharacterized protein n=1 Tax=Arundo donax TaxID=35708 RepID=A0A0A9H9K2_ARUDO